MVSPSLVTRHFLDESTAGRREIPIATEILCGFREYYGHRRFSAFQRLHLLFLQRLDKLNGVKFFKLKSWLSLWKE